MSREKQPKISPATEAAPAAGAEISAAEAAPAAQVAPAAPHRDIGLKRRYRAEKRFRFYGIAAVSFGLFFLAFLLYSVFSQGIGSFRQTTITVPVAWDAQLIDPQHRLAANPQLMEDAHFLAQVDYSRLLSSALAQRLGVSPEDLPAMKALMRLVSPSARGAMRRFLGHNPQVIGTIAPVTLLASAEADAAYKGLIDFSGPESERRISDRQKHWLDQLAADGMLHKSFNIGLFTRAASAYAESSGLAAALLGSFYMMAVVVLLALPLGVAAAVYLEEYAHKNRWTDLIEININNLAAVPSIVFGILGLAVFINFFGLPRSASLVGGLVLTLMTLPTIIIAARSALQAVPSSIRAAALGLGASKTQAVFHFVLPQAAPGILTGAIIGLARALGETAPLLLIGMVAFVANYPATPLAPATALPVQIYMWAGEAERSFEARSSAAIIVLLAFLALMNVAAVFLRRYFERRR